MALHFLQGVLQLINLLQEIASLELNFQFQLVILLRQLIDLLLVPLPLNLAIRFQLLHLPLVGIPELLEFDVVALVGGIQ